MIVCNFDWGMGQLDQKLGRIFRLGQSSDVFMDFLISDKTAEVTKVARLISTMHITRQVNSDYSDNTEFEPISMTVDIMTNFNKFSDLQPFVDRMEDIHENELKESKFWEGYYKKKLPIGASVIEGKCTGKQLKGGYLMEEVPELRRVEEIREAKATEEDHITLYCGNYDGKHYLVIYKDDPNHTKIKSLGFNQEKAYYWLYLKSKPFAMNILRKIQMKGLDIIEKEKLIKQVKKTKVMANLITRAKKKKNGLGIIDLCYTEIDDYPHFALDIDEETKDIAKLKLLGFKKEPKAYYKIIKSKTDVKLILRKIQQEGLIIENRHELKKTLKRVIKMEI